MVTFEASWGRKQKGKTLLLLNSYFNKCWIVDRPNKDTELERNNVVQRYNANDNVSFMLYANDKDSTLIVWAYNLTETV